MLSDRMADRAPLVGTCALAGGVLATICPHVGPVTIVSFAAVAFVASLLVIPIIDRPAAAHPRAAFVERWAPVVVLAFFVPVATLAVVPGADASMYAAIARSIATSQRA